MFSDQAIYIDPGPAALWPEVKSTGDRTVNEGSLGEVPRGSMY